METALRQAPWVILRGGTFILTCGVSDLKSSTCSVSWYFAVSGVKTPVALEKILGGTTNIFNDYMLTLTYTIKSI